MADKDNSETVNNTKELKGKYTAKYDAEEIDPLKTNGTSEKPDIKITLPPDESGAPVNGSGGESNGVDNGIDGLQPIIVKSRNQKLKERVSGILEKYEISDRAKKIISILLVLLVILIVSLVTLIVLWPSIPEYMKMSVCTERDCFEASAQVSFFFVPQSSYIYLNKYYIM